MSKKPCPSGAQPYFQGLWSHIPRTDGNRHSHLSGGLQGVQHSLLNKRHQSGEVRGSGRGGDARTEERSLFNVKIFKHTSELSHPSTGLCWRRRFPKNTKVGQRSFPTGGLHIALPHTPSRDLAPLDKLDFDLEDKHPTHKLRPCPHLQNLCTSLGRGALLGPGHSWVSFQPGVLRTNGVVLSEWRQWHLSPSGQWHLSPSVQRGREVKDGIIRSWFR